MLIKEFTWKGTKHIVLKDPTASGGCAVPIGPGYSPFADEHNRWSWNGSADKPTVHPSIHCRGLCHFNVTDGMVIFHGDEPNGGRTGTAPLEDLGDMADFWSDR